MPRGRLITLEGGEGAGKSTQLRALTVALKAYGVDTAATREPGGTPEGEAIRTLLLDGEPDRFDPVSQALLHFAARREHLRQTILPLLDGGTWVICDRFADSTMAYQGYGAGLGRGPIDAIHRISIGDFAPDLTAILDIAPGDGTARLDIRNERRNAYEQLDRTFHERVRAGFLDIARRAPQRCLVVDATLPEAAVTAAIFEAIEQRLGLPLMARSPAAKDAPELPHPREVADLVGHQATERLLADACRSGRLPHAWVLAGPAGIGKTTLAYRFARFVLAGGAEPAAAMGEDGSLAVAEDGQVFRQVAAGSHTDLLGVERPIDPKQGRRTGDLPVEQIRRIAPFLRLTASGGGWRVVIVDEAERMNRSSANALLKILEEPPRRSMLLLVTDQPGILLPTIRSRCRRLLLSTLPDAAVDAFLASRLPELPADQRGLAVRLSQGAPGRALLLASTGAQAVYGTLFACVDTLPHLDWIAIHALGDQVAAPGAEALFGQVAEIMVDIEERIVRLVATGRDGRPVVPGEQASLRKLAALGDLDRWLQVWENTRRLFRRADQANLDRKQAILSAFSALQAAL